MAQPYHHLYPSPLRYPGGKGKLANYVKLLLITNGLVGCEYVEPYAGGASVALSLLFEEYASHIHINDLNRSVMAFWWAVLGQTDALCRRIERAVVTMREWERQRAVQLEPDPEPLDLAFSTFFLNRTNRSGIIEGGVIGGQDQTGPWKLDARFNRGDLIRRIRRIARFKTRITLSEMDAADYIRDQLPSLANPFVYLDPPYYVKGEGLYEHSYTDKDHVEIAALVHALPSPWIVTYDAVSQIEQLYQRYETAHYDLHYNAQARYRGNEVMVFSSDLVPYSEAAPPSVSWRTIDSIRRWSGCV
jgi:DNA adenine methylase